MLATHAYVLPRPLQRLSCTWLIGTLLWLALPTQARADILIVSPHPDDDIITSAGVIKRAIQRGEAVRIVYVTNGDFGGVSIANIRQAEAVEGQGYLGTAEDRLSFLGYPDASLSVIRFNYTAPGSLFTSPNGVSHTYASRGLGGTDYHTYRFGSPGLYNWPTMVGDLADIVNTSRPTHIFTTSQWDTHSDHSTTYWLVREAVQQIVSSVPGYNPTIHKTSVWPGDPVWPLPSDGSTYFTPFNHLGVDDPTELVWSERESLDVPSLMQVTFSPTNAKYLAISAHESQGGMGRYIGQWVHKDEFFWTEQATGTNRPPVPDAGLDQQVDEGVLVTLDGSASWDRNGGLVTHQWRQVAGPPVTLSSLAATRPTFVSPTGLAADTVLEFELVVGDGAVSSVPDGARVIVRSALPPPSYGPNVAPLASIAASSERVPSGQIAAKVADGFIDGYPGDSSREWVTAVEGVGAWIQMNWPSPQTIGRIVLFDRPNLDDQILGGVISFSDGSTLPVGPLANNAGATEYTFASRAVTSLRLTVTQVSSNTANVGMAELQVFQAAGLNQAPVANAGPDQIVPGGQVVTLNGTGSTDPNSDPLTYTWTRMSGPAVTLSSSTAASPTFTAPAALPAAQTIRFSLVVRDGEFTSTADLVDIIIPGTVNAPPLASAGPDTVVSAGGTVTLNGTASADPEGLPVTYVWTQTAGPGVTLSSTTAVMPTFSTPPSTADAVLTFRLVVRDGVNNSAPDTVNVTVVALPSPASNIAPVGTVTASTERAPTQAASKAVDGFVDGFPGDASREWSTVAEGAGAWIQLEWPVAHLVARMRLHDRPNADDHIRSGTLTFSDGSTIPVAALENDGTASELVFAPRMIRWVQFTVATVSPSTGNAGLAELLVFEQAGAPTNQPPTAIAGPAQTVAGGSTVVLDARGSTDPEGSTLTFAWAQASGPAVTLTGATTAQPSFITPAATRQAQVLRFQLTVSDGTQTSGDTVDITITPLPNTAPDASAGPDQTVNGGATVRLDGRGSVDAELDPLFYHWTQTAGPPVTLTGPTTSTPSFVAPAADTHSSVLVFELVVDDGIFSSPVDSVMLTVAAVPSAANVAVIATVTASAEALPAQGAVEAIDGVVAGFPVMASAEWVAPAGGVGSWIQLDWATDRVVNVVRLYDRVNADDRITGGMLQFSDGSGMTFGALPNSNGSPLELTFAPKTIRWVRMTVNSVGVSTNSIGLAEIEVFEGTTAPPAIAIGDVTVMEGSSPNLMAVFTVTLSRAIAQAVTVDYATANGTAVAVQDFTAASGTVTFAPGVVSQTVSVPILDDITNEPTETFVVSLTRPGNATISDALGVGTIVENDTVPALSISGTTILEGNTGTVSAIFGVSLSAASGQTVTVGYTTVNGTATAPSDYTATSGTLTFAPGTLSQTVAVTIAGDTLDEANETVFVDLSAPSNATIATGRGTAAINDDDTAAAISVSDVTVTETNTGANVNAVFTVSLSTASGQTVTVSYAAANGTASAPQDYSATSGTLTFAPGSMTQTITVPVVGDNLDEANETFVVNLSAPGSATIADGQGTGTITDNDGTPSLTVGDVTVTEANTGTNVNAVFTVTLSAASGQPVTVSYATANGTAVAPADYTAGSGTLTFAAGITTRTVTVPVFGDVLDEANEAFVVNLSGAANAAIADAQATGTITDNDTAPTLAVGDVTVAEANTGTNVSAVFTVMLSAASGQTVTVNYATANGIAAAPADYTAASGTLTFAAGTTSRTITVPVIGDVLDEANETFVVNLTSPVNVTTPDTQAVGTITDNDTAPTIVIGDIAVTETNTGTNVNAVFTLTLSAASGQVATVSYATANATAAAPGDYTAAAGTLTFAAGTTSRTVTVPVIGDLLDEPSETFVVNLSGAANATIADAQATGTITDNDTPPAISIADVAVTEANTGTSVNAVFTVTLSTASALSVTVSYATANGTATAPADYTAASGTLTFAAGTTTRTITVPVIGDNLDEVNETYVLNLSAPVNATTPDTQATGTINDNDNAPSISISNASVTEGNTGTVTVNVTVSLSAPSGQPVTVNIASANGTATDGQDYVGGSGPLTFAPGTTSIVIPGTIIGDLRDEADETILVNLSAPVNATIADNQGVITIVDNDPTPALSISSVSVTEPDSGSVNLVFTVTLSAASGRAVTVHYATANGSASQPSDYSSRSGTLTFNGGVTTMTITVPVNGDRSREGNETFSVNLSGASNATINLATGTGTILNDD